MNEARRVVNVGIIGCGEVTQVIHLPNLNFMSEYFKVVHLCDVSLEALRHSSQKVVNHIPRTTQDPRDICESPEVQLVLVVNSDEYHADHAILALEHGKHVFIEKPMALCLRDADRIIEAEKAAEGKVMVGYMRRYAAAYIDALKEIGGMDKVLYARARDIIGPNSTFVGQSGTFPKQFHDISGEKVQEKKSRAEEMVQQALENECGVSVTPQSTRMWRNLGSLGSHDLSAMREALGMPQEVLGASPGFPYWTVLFQYPGFALTYESGIDENSRFDAHIEVYSLTKSVRIQYDTPYVKGLPTTMHIRENINGTYRETMVRRTYEDPYTLEMKELYRMVVDGVQPKTTAEDAREDLKIFQMIMKAGFNTKK